MNLEGMRHRNCGGLVRLSGPAGSAEFDRYECMKCHRGWMCVGQEDYLADVLEPGEPDRNY